MVECVSTSSYIYGDIQNILNENCCRYYIVRKIKSLRNTGQRQKLNYNEEFSMLVMSNGLFTC